MSQAPTGGELPAPRDYRADFSAFMKMPETRRNADTVAFHSVGAMNRRMVTEGVPMTEAHYRAATSSMARGDTLCGFLKAEHDHVMHSTGDGHVYTAGKKFHEYVVGPLKDLSE